MSEDNTKSQEVRRELSEEEKRHNLLHVLWTKAVGTADYNKDEWRQLERLLKHDFRVQTSLLQSLCDALERIRSQIESVIPKHVSADDKLHMALYHSFHDAEQALSEAKPYLTKSESNG